jgi:hypothetical protein
MNNIDDVNNNSSKENNSKINEESKAMEGDNNTNSNLNYDSQDSENKNKDDEYSGEDSILELSENFSESEKYKEKIIYD